jgi:hypothetical protein
MLLPEIVATLLACDSHIFSRGVHWRVPDHEVWLVSERGRIELRYEHPGRSETEVFWLSCDRCRTPDGGITSIGYTDDDRIPWFEFTFAEPSPSHMRPARRYGVMFPHDIISGLPMAAIQSLIFEVSHGFAR